MYDSKIIVVALLTDSYAGNFEREATAYCTGVIGECGVGDKYVDENLRDEFEGYVVKVPDDHGCYRPTTCSADEAGVSATFADVDCKWNEAVFIYFEPNVPRKLLEIVDKRAKEFFSTVPDWRGEPRNIKYNGLVVMERDIKISSNVIYTI